MIAFILIFLLFVLVGCNSRPENYDISTEKNKSENIETFRKGNFIIEVPKIYQDCLISIKQIDHEYIFGGTLPSTFFESEQNYSNYQDIISVADSMFNTFVDESSFKWDYLETDGSSGNLTVNKRITEWASKNNNSLRHHTLFWANSDHIPDWVKQLNNTELRTAIFDRIKFVADEVGADITALDVVNEMLIYSYFRDKLGDNIIVEIFNEVKRLIPNAQLYLNENPLHFINKKENLIKISDATQLKEAIINNFMAFLEEMDDLGVHYDKIALQAHFADINIYSAGLNFDFTNQDFIDLYEELIEEIANYTDKSVLISEFDFKSTNRNDQANFIVDFYTMVFEKENTEGIIYWYWLIHMDGSEELIDLQNRVLNYSGQTLNNLINNIWNSHYENLIPKDGYVNVDAFYGTYEVSYIRNGEIIKTQIINFLSE